MWTIPDRGSLVVGLVVEHGCANEGLKGTGIPASDASYRQAHFHPAWRAVISGKTVQKNLLSALVGTSEPSAMRSDLSMLCRIP